MCVRYYKSDGDKMKILKYKKVSGNKYSLVLLITLICYIIQDFFNLSVVIVSPLFWMVMALHFLSISDK